MKRLGIIIMTLLSIVVMSSSVLMETVRKGRSIEALWDKYAEAKEVDAVQDMADVLEEIKAASLRSRASADYFKACDEYVNVKSRQNWKLTSSLIDSAAMELRSYGEPSLEIYFGMRHNESTDSLVEMIGREAAVMKKSVNRALYDNYVCAIFNAGPNFRRLMQSSIDNDYEFIMWQMISERGYDWGPVFDEFVEYLDGEYPAVPYIYYQRLMHVSDRDAFKSILEEMAELYAGRGIGMVAEDELFRIRFIDMRRESTSGEYRELERDIVEFEERRKALKGDEAAVAEIAENASDILETLRKSEVIMRIEDGTAKLMMRNADKAEIVLRKGEDVVFEAVAVNDVLSFYKQDTLEVDIPALDDGTYTASVYYGQKEVSRHDYAKYTISLGRRMADDGMCIYAADYMTGEPVEKADLILYNHSMEEVIAEVKGFIFNGFTELPKEIYPFRDRKGYRLVCRYEKDGLLRSSKPMHFSNREFMPSRSETMIEAKIVKDRAAFMRGDTVRFKTFLYEERPDGTRASAAQGREMVVKIKDPAGDIIAEMTLMTNEFGSASGSFVIDEDGRNGMWAISVRSGGHSSEPSYFTVDDFVLPSYDLQFGDGKDKLYFPGDSIRVCGKVMSYSGHGLSGLDVSALIYVDNEFVGEQEVRLGPDGSFEVSFVAGEGSDYYVSYMVGMRLRDMTGETLEFNWNSRAVREMSVRAKLVNHDSGGFAIKPDPEFPAIERYSDDGLLSAGTAEIICRAGARGSDVPGIPMDYELRYEGVAVKSGRVVSGDTLRIDVSGFAPGLYRFEAKASMKAPDGRDVSGSDIVDILYMPEDADVMPAGTGRMFRTFYENGEIIMQLGSGNGPVWAVVELFGRDAVPLKKLLMHMDGTAGVKGSLEKLVFPHMDEYSDKVLLNVFYFKDGKEILYHETFTRPEEDIVLPLGFTSFTDKAFPGQEVSLKIKTSADAEVLVSVFDASSQKIQANSWNGLRFEKADYPLYMYYSSVPGCNESDFYVVGFALGKKASMSGSNAMARESAADDSFAEEAVPFQLDETGKSSAGAAVRDDFATTLAFEPFLRPSHDGTVEMKFRTSGKLSTFIVRALAHDKSMNTALAEKEMLVTLPVRVSVVQPMYLYVGDKYVLNASVSNTSGSALRGRVHLEVYDGEAYLDAEPVIIDSLDVEVPEDGSSAVSFDVNVPGGVDTLGFKVIFIGHECPSDSAEAVHELLISDGIFVTVPVYPAAQVLTEAHSAVLTGGQSSEEIIGKLKDEFVNVSSVGAEYSEIKVMDMIRDALPVAYESDSKDAVSLSEAVYVNFMAAGLRRGDDESVKECVAAAMNSVSALLACVNNDGGFGWFEGMPSSPVVTAVVLERVAGLRDRRLLDVASYVWGEDSLDDLDSAVPGAVKYLDSSYFGNSERPLWHGGLTLGQYLNVRSMYSGVPFDEDAAREAVGKKAYRQFTRNVRDYLIPKEAVTSGYILSKVRKVRIIDALTEGSPTAFRLAKAWGVSSAGNVRKMVKYMHMELRSLKQYAVGHPSGGVYYPNAVLPWRGLLESEAYAHAQICDLFRDVADEYYGGADFEKIADGIRIWLMIQKEGQEWSSDPGFVEALASVYDGSRSVMDTRVIVLRKRYVKPFEAIKAAGNGFTVSVDYYKAGPDGARVRLAEGDFLRVGDKITAVYSLWSGENRSHVRLSVPRAACFRPVEQLSGWSGGWFRPLIYGFINVYPYSYREVRAGRTMYWIDVFPEEKTVIEEELFVTQEGVFTAPAAEIESLYAPHYRANSPFGGKVSVSGEN